MIMLCLIKTILLCLFINILLTNGVLGSAKITKSIEELGIEYEDEKNFWIAIPSNTEDVFLYDDFYEDLDNRIRVESSMNILFFGPPSSYMRLETEAIIQILVHIKSHLIPLTRVILSWDLITDGKTAAFLQGRELLAFGSLLNKVPEEDLYHINFGDPTVLRYFATEDVMLNLRKMGILGSAYRRYYGNEWYTNGTLINEMGNLLCAFPASDLEYITPAAFKEIGLDVFTKLSRCRHDQKQVLYKLAIKPEAYGEPYKWTSHEITRIDSLITCTPNEDISSIQLEAMYSISKRVMKQFNQKKLSYFTGQQVLRMNANTRRVYIIRMQLAKSVDMEQLRKGSQNFKLKLNTVLLFSGSVATLLL